MNSPCKIVLAPNAFKESLTASEAVQALKAGIKSTGIPCEIVEAPLSDGGDGMLAFFAGREEFEIVNTSARNPLGQEIDTKFGILSEKTAIIEMALISGLALISRAERDPRGATSFGTGQLIKQAYDKNIRDFIIGIGGSATNDGGSGLATALGYQFLDANGNPIPAGGAGLKFLAEITRIPGYFNFEECEIKVACDVDNPLLGSRGAIHTFGAQKGLDDAGVIELESSMENLSEVIEKKISGQFHNLPGAGAAGGVGFVLPALFNARIQAGSELVMSLTGFDEKIKNADLIITGEGALDSQSAFGKIPGEVSKKGQAHNIPVIALAGSLEVGWQNLQNHGLKKAYQIAPAGTSREESIKKAAMYLELKAREAVLEILNE